MNRIRWGILGAAKIAVQKVIPGMQASRYCEIAAIASRHLEKSQTVARHLQIPKAYGSYEDLLGDPDIDAVYIPLPNHLHVPWAIKALDAGKHVLCEKPLGLSADEAQQLVDAAKAKPRLKVMEAFMYRHHPQWQTARQLIAGGKIGEVRTIHSFFSYYNDDPGNIRNKPEIGGGSLMDIGCYCISLARFLFDAEPKRVCGIIEYDPTLKIDRLVSGLLDFGGGTSTFTCSTQLTPYQRVNIFGAKGRVEIEIPFNAPPDRPCRIWHQHGTALKEIVLEVCDQYTIQGDLFSQAIIHDTNVPTPLEDAVRNMRVLEAIVLSAGENRWV